jgi:hypothetical protein
VRELTKTFWMDKNNRWEAQQIAENERQKRQNESKPILYFGMPPVSLRQIYRTVWCLNASNLPW